MKLRKFLLDEWLYLKFEPGLQIEFDLAASTGPAWTMRELLGLTGRNEYEEMMDRRIAYVTAAGTAELREAIAEMQDVRAEDVQIVTGASEALLIICFLAAEKGANVVMPNLGYPSNLAIAESVGLEVRQYHLRAGKNFRIDVDEIAGLMDGETRFVLVNTPHNPTGAVVSDEEMAALHELCMARGVQLIVDEVYHPIYHGAASRSAARFEQVTVIGDLSKALCLSGLRVGWIVERDRKRRERYENARDYFTACCGSVNEWMATVAVRAREKIFTRTQEVAGGNLAQLEAFFLSHAEEIDWKRPGGGMTAFPAFRDGRDSREFCLKLARRGVLIAPGDCFGEAAHFRVGFAASVDGFGSALERVEDVLREGRD